MTRMAVVIFIGIALIIVLSVGVLCWRELMNRAEAINLLSNLIGMVEDSKGNDYDRAIKMGIKALDKHKPMWISCEDRLPDVDGRYLVVINNTIRQDFVEIMSFGHPVMPDRKLKKKQKCWYSFSLNGDFKDIVRDDVVAWTNLPTFEMEQRYG